MQPGAATRVRTWTPKAGHFHGFLITHGEAISIADYFTVRQSSEVVYRPTVHYAYHPSDSAVVSVHEFAGRNWHLQDRQRILMDEITSGIDELGVLLAGHKKNAYWYGSQLSHRRGAQARAAQQRHQPAGHGVVPVGHGLGDGEPERRASSSRTRSTTGATSRSAMPYLGTLTGAYTDWTPLHDRERLFPEDLDKTDPWQFKNVRVVSRSAQRAFERRVTELEAALGKSQRLHALATHQQLGHFAERRPQQRTRACAATTDDAASA